MFLQLKRRQQQKHKLRGEFGIPSTAKSKQEGDNNKHTQRKREIDSVCVCVYEC